MNNSMIMRKRLNKERRALLKKSKIKYKQEYWTNNEQVCESVPSATPTTRRSAPPSMKASVSPSSMSIRWRMMCLNARQWWMRNVKT